METDFFEVTSGASVTSLTRSSLPFRHHPVHLHPRSPTQYVPPTAFVYIDPLFISTDYVEFEPALDVAADAEMALGTFYGEPERI